MDEGEAGILDGVRDGGLLHKLVLEPGRGRSIIHSNYAAKALDVPVDDFDATCSSGALRELRRHTRSLLDLGFGGVSLYAQGRCEANVPVIGLESLVWWACDSEVIHDGGGGQLWLILNACAVHWVEGVRKAQTSESAALFNTTFGGELSHDVSVVHDEECGGRAICEVEGVPAWTETPVSID